MADQERTAKSAIATRRVGRRLDDQARADGVRAGAPAVPADAAAGTPAPQERKDRLGIAFWMAVVWLLVVVFCALFAAFIPGLADPLRINVPDRLAPPLTPGHPLGADGLGRDILARIVHGSRVSVTIAFSAVAIGMTVGGILGMCVGYFRGRAERWTMSGVDVILAFPGLVLLLALVAYVGQSLTAVALVIGLLSIPVYTRVARANTLSVAQREFVLAAKALGAGTFRVLSREILPNVMLPVLAFALIAMGVVIVIEGALAFLGLSVQPPTPTWGSMINEGRRHFRDAGPHVALIPSAVMFLTVLSLNFVGDTLRRRFDVREANL